jgi:hypothetical protein
MSKGADRIARTIVLFDVPSAATHPLFVYRPAKMRDVTGRIYYERLQSGWVPVRILLPPTCPL